MKERILFVDDDQAGRELSLFNLVQAGYEVEEARDGKGAIAGFSGDRHQLVITDLRMPQVSGLEVLAHVKRVARDVPVVVITAHGSIELAVQAMKAGAYDFLEKPFGREVLLMVVDRSLERRRLAVENRLLRLRASGVERELVAVSEPMHQLMHTTDRVAQSDASVLITGESGVGKELIARRLHARSARAERAFVVVNCAAMPAELLESELFGHEKGAYTGAVRARPGRFRLADGGTIFLDEVAEIPLSLQAKLLRVLQEKTVDVVGADRPVPVDVRVVAATHQDLGKMVAAGSFREDLYYRLDVVQLRVPALRERTADIEVLARHFLARLAPDRELLLPDELLAELCQHSWPGNVRELENACERLVTLCDGDTLRRSDLPPTIRDVSRPLANAASVSPSTSTSTSTINAASDPTDEWPPLPAEGISLVDLERRVIERALRIKAGNVSQAAAFLRVPRHILAYRIEKFGIRRG